MKASFRTIERDDDQRNRKWRALLLGLLVSGAGVGLAIGPLVPSVPIMVMSIVALGSTLSGLVVGWCVRERKGSMGGMVAQLFAFPLGCLIAGEPQQTGLNWIVCLFVAVPFAAMGGSFGARFARNGLTWLPIPLGITAVSLMLLAGCSRLAVGRKLSVFAARHQAALVKDFDDNVIRGARNWPWSARWQKGIWDGDYLLLTAQPNGWRSAHIMVSDTAPPRLLTFWASRRGTQQLSPALNESNARKRLRALGFRDRLLNHPQWNDELRNWGYRRGNTRSVIYTRRDDAAVMFDGREEASLPATGQVVAARR